MGEKEFIDGEREIRKKYDLLLLVELLNFYYKNTDIFEVKNVVNSLHDAVIYDYKEKEELIEEAKKIVKEKYGRELD